MRAGAIGSAALHVAVVAAALVTWPQWSSPELQESAIAPIELVTIDEVANLIPQTRAPEPEPEPTPAPPEPEPEPATAPTVAALPPEPEPESAPVEPEPVPEPDPAPAEAAPEPQPVEEARLPKPKPKAPPRRPQPQQEQFDVDRVLGLLDDRPQAQPPREDPSTQRRGASETVRGAGRQDAMTLDLQNAMRAMMRECWSPPVGAPNPETLVVEVRIRLNPDGTLSGPPELVDRGRIMGSGDRFLQVAGRNAERAVHMCQPYRLPPERYALWREITLSFDPRRMAGR